jgi:hypothetical protein
MDTILDGEVPGLSQLVARGYLCNRIQHADADRHDDGGRLYREDIVIVARALFRYLRQRSLLKVLPAVILLVGSLLGAATTGAANTFAAPAFQAQWQAGEAIAPNFWGPLETAQPGQQEFYADAPGKQRLVQYFDKGRMELTNPANGTVTNGLLATELITGRLQVGDTTFEAHESPAIPIAGDPDNPGPTYLALHTTASALLTPAPDAAGSNVTARVSASGDLSSGGAMSGTAIAAYDAATQHNVSAPFAAYRDKVGLLTIGYAQSEPFGATVKVAGVQRDVIIQAFERRILTYTPTNPDPFKVEMGNIGRHYYQWRSLLGVAAPGASSVASPSPAATTTTPPATGSGPLTVAFGHVTSPVLGGNAVAITVQATPGAICSGTITGSFRPSTSREINLEKMTVGGGGSVTWSSVISLDANPGTWPISVTCASKGQSVSASSSVTVQAEVVPG